MLGVAQHLRREGVVTKERGPARFARSSAPFTLDRHALAFRFRRLIPSTTAHINRTVKEILRLARAHRCLPPDLPEVEIALREALANAVLHGNRRDAGKKVLVRAYGDPDQGFLIVVRDEGSGFDPAEVPDPRREDRLELPHGRGIFLMRELMDHVEHRKGGREVLLFKRAL